MHQQSHFAAHFMLHWKLHLLDGGGETLERFLNSSVTSQFKVAIYQSVQHGQFKTATNWAEASALCTKVIKTACKPFQAFLESKDFQEVSGFEIFGMVSKPFWLQFCTQNSRICSICGSFKLAVLDMLIYRGFSVLIFWWLRIVLGLAMMAHRYLSWRRLSIAWRPCCRRPFVVIQTRCSPVLFLCRCFGWLWCIHKRLSRLVSQGCSQTWQIVFTRWHGWAVFAQWLPFLDVRGRVAF